jgi:hypothetical protein
MKLIIISLCVFVLFYIAFVEISFTPCNLNDLLQGSYSNMEKSCRLKLIKKANNGNNSAYWRVLYFYERYFLDRYCIDQKAQQELDKEELNFIKKFHSGNLDLCTNNDFIVGLLKKCVLREGNFTLCTERIGKEKEINMDEVIHLYYADKKPKE